MIYTFLTDASEWLEVDFIKMEKNRGRAGFVAREREHSL